MTDRDEWYQALKAEANTHMACRECGSPEWLWAIMSGDGIEPRGHLICNDCGAMIEYRAIPKSVPGDVAPLKNLFPRVITCPDCGHPRSTGPTTPCPDHHLTETPRHD